MATVLIVDDHAPNRHFLLTLLGRHHYDVLEASNGAEALTLVNTGRPDLVISDIVMPIMDGYEFVRRLRSDPATVRLPVIFCTAHYDKAEARELAKSCGVVQVLMKPCDAALTVRTVAQALATPVNSLAPLLPADFDHEHARACTGQLAETADKLRVANLRFSDVVARLQEREAGLSRAQHMANLAHVITGADGAFESWSDTLPALIGVASSHMPKSAREWIELVHPDDRAMVRAKSIDAATRGVRVDSDYRLRRARDRAWIQIRQVVEPLAADAGVDGVQRWFSTLQDLTVQKTAEAVLRSRTAVLQRMSRRFMTAEEEERRRLGRELHDRVGANLSALLLSIEVLRSKLAPGLAPELLARVGDCEILLRETVGNVRNVLADLHPPALDELGLLAALSHYVRLLAQRGDVEIVTEGEEPSPRLSDNVAISMFRIAQEALNNATRHAHAIHVTVALRSAAAEVTLSVTDDGRGFDPALVPHGAPHFGLATMRERAEAIGGRCTVDSTPGNGTRVIVSVPIALTQSDGAIAAETVLQCLQ